MGKALKPSVYHIVDKTTFVEIHDKDNKCKSIFSVDTDDFYRLGLDQYNFHLSSSNNIPGFREGYTPKILSRKILNPKPSLFVDHIDGNTLNNCKSNLRVVTPQQNACNRNPNRKTYSGRSGIRFINKPENKLKWLARLMFKNECVLSKCFATYQEALEARHNAEIKYFGEFKRAD